MGIDSIAISDLCLVHDQHHPTALTECLPGPASWRSVAGCIHQSLGPELVGPVDQVVVYLHGSLDLAAGRIAAVDHRSLDLIAGAA